mmetsp:Transcript_30819/g.100363  ORF Transcript_30819/g.100363 Transcript_30819/m.100363 type:complete len:226 (+) Transcript_30819:677-1354(+)
MDGLAFEVEVDVDRVGVAVNEVVVALMGESGAALVCEADVVDDLQRGDDSTLNHFARKVVVHGDVVRFHSLVVVLTRVPVLAVVVEQGLLHDELETVCRHKCHDDGREVDVFRGEDLDERLAHEASFEASFAFLIRLIIRDALETNVTRFLFRRILIQYLAVPQVLQVLALIDGARRVVPVFHALFVRLPRLVHGVLCGLVSIDSRLDDRQRSRSGREHGDRHAG